MTNKFAEDLWKARIDGALLAREDTVDPQTEKEAYDVQSAIISLSGLNVIGWKIGATNEALFKVLGVTQPFLGPLFRRFTYENDAEIPVLAGHGLETEFTIRMKSALPCREEPYSREEVADAVAAIIPSFEIVGVRFEGGPVGAGYRIIADCGANVGTVLGPEIHDWSGYNLMDFPVTLRVNGAQVGEGNSSSLLWDHISDAVIWTLRQPAVRDRGLLSGDLIMTGTFTGITPLSSGDQVEADFGKMGVIRSSFV